MSLLLSRVILFIIYLSSSECRDLPSSHLYWYVKKWWEKRYFNCMLPLPPTCICVCYMSYVFLQSQKRDKLNRSFFPYWCATEASFPAGVQNGLLSKCWRFTNFLLWNFAMAPNKMATGHKTHALGRQPSNDHSCQIWFASLHWLWRKCNLTIFQFHGAFCCQGNKTKRQIIIILAICKCPYPSNICTKLESYCFGGFGVVVPNKSHTALAVLKELSLKKNPSF